MKKKERENQRTRKGYYTTTTTTVRASAFPSLVLFSPVCVYTVHVHGRGEYIELYSTDTNTDRHTHTNSA